MLMGIDVSAFDLNILEMRTRMPFKYGIATLTALPHLFVTLDVRIDGDRGVGIAADGLPPKWFTKDADKRFRVEIAELLDVVRHACDAVESVGPAPSVFELWRRVSGAQRAWAEESTAYPPLLWAFGVSLVERALIDAFCRVSGVSFGASVRSNLFGIQLGALSEELTGVRPADCLPEQPLRTIAVRHTVGLADPLTRGELEAGDRLDDGLPQSLDEAIEFYGLTHFKIKIGGDLGADVERLRRLSEVIGTHAGSGFCFSLDANEQYDCVDRFREFWESARADRGISGFFDHLLFVEQPFQRAIALADTIGTSLLSWSDRPPIIIDESDGELTSLRRALDLGYRGTSHKNCKGVFKSLANRCLLERRQLTDPGGRYLMSAEDLANVGPVALMEDLAVVATLGIPHAERNGHHYFRGMSMLPPDLQEALLDAHPDVYHRHPDGYPTLDVREGQIAVGSVVDAPFGVALDIDARRFASADSWSPDALGDV